MMRTISRPPGRPMLLATSACAMFLLATPFGGAAQAQETATTQDSASSDHEGSAGGQESLSVQQSDDIVVTATRSSTLASKTPIALTAITGDGLRSAGVTSTVDLASQVPNLSIDRNAGIQITIRGVSSTDSSEKGDPSAAFLLDGIYIARTQATDTSFFDIERVEVLRGPQGTLYGRNTTAGLVNVITNKPVQAFQVAGNAAIGNYGTYQADAMVNVPVTDALAVRGAVSYDRRDSYLRNAEGVSNNLSPFKNNISTRLSALWNISSDASLLVRGAYSRMRGNYSNVVLNTQAYDTSDPQNPVYIGDGSSRIRTLTYDQGSPAETRDKTWGIGAEFNWDFGPLTMTYLGSYREFDRNEDFVGYVGIPVHGPFTGNYRQNSQELRFALNDGGPFKLQFGGYYFREKSDIVLYLLGLEAYVGAPYYGFPQHTNSESSGVFGQATYSLTPNLRLTGGLRYSRDQKDRHGGTVFQQTDTFNPATDTLYLNYADRSFSKLTWRAGIDWDASPLTLVYGSVATGYKAGGFNDGCLEGSSYGGVTCNQVVSEETLYYKPETLTAYEVGVKTRTSNGALRLNASAFYYDYKNLQLTELAFSNNAPIQVTQNAATARVKGVELEGVLAPSPRNRLDLAFTWLDAHYVDYMPLGESGPDYAGRKLDRSPPVTVSAGYTYTLPLANEASLVANVRSRLSAAYVLTDFSTPAQYRQPSYTRTDASLQYNAAGGSWYLAAFVRNIENTVTVTSITTYTLNPGDPRTYGLRAGFRF